jgi:hypothetical protein
MAGTDNSGEELRGGGGGEPLGYVVVVVERREGIRSEPRSGRGAKGVGGRMGRGGHRSATRTPSPATSLHAAAVA